ncbi:MAG: glycosyltransferase family 4 protein [Patescibacteria group bacterium]|nr:glycosyltransferase family 4 protein [Patescibacteria group bacterium]
MKLLILTQKVDKDDPILGFFHYWLKEFAKHCSQVIVICLYKGDYDLPDNVRVLSLGKESGVSRIKYIFRFYKYIWQYRKEYENVFVHMNQVYVILGAWFWKIMHKKIGLWYTHKNINNSLKLAEKLTDIIFSASDSSFRLQSKKLKVMGHGIDTEKFSPKDKQVEDNDVFNILTVGRISPIKKYEQLIEALVIIKQRKINKKIFVNIVGGPVMTADENYFEQIKTMAREKGLSDIVSFVGPVSNDQVVKYFRGANLLVHMCQEGGLDKVSLEAMACGTLVLSNNDAVKNDVLSDYKDYLGYEKDDIMGLADKIIFLINKDKKERRLLGKKLRELVANNHEIGILVEKILKEYK